MTAPFQYLLITVKVLTLEEVSFSGTQNPKTFVNTLTVNVIAINFYNFRKRLQISKQSK